MTTNLSNLQDTMLNFVTDGVVAHIWLNICRLLSFPLSINIGIIPDNSICRILPWFEVINPKGEVGVYHGFGGDYSYSNMIYKFIYCKTYIL